MFNELLDHNNNAVRLAAIQAVANVATGERAQDILRVIVENQ